MDPRRPEPMPPAVRWLGYGGLLPFLLLAPASLIDPAHAMLWSDALHAYGAVILSFVGALHWGFAMTLSDLSAPRRQSCFIWSVIPALLAWLAQLLAPPLASILLVSGFLAHYGQDRRLAGLVNLPDWYLPLRLRLSSVACLCLAAGGFVSFG